MSWEPGIWCPARRRWRRSTRGCGKRRLGRSCRLHGLYHELDSSIVSRTRRVAAESHGVAHEVARLLRKGPIHRHLEAVVAIAEQDRDVDARKGRRPWAGGGWYAHFASIWC